MGRWLIAVALAAFAAPAAAADWRITGLNGQAGDRTLFLVDADSTRTESGAASFWLQMLYEQPFRGVNRVMNRLDARCADRSFTIATALFYLDDEARLQETTRSERIFAAPDSAFEAAILAACSGRWPGGTVADPRAAAAAIFRAADPARTARSY